MKNIAIGLFAISFIYSSSFAQPTQEWIQRYNGPANSFDIVAKLLLDDLNNVYVYGSSSGFGSLYDFAIVKYNLAGNLQWVQRYNGNGNSVDQILSACLDASGNSYVTGFTTDSSLINRITTTKYNQDGNLLWLNVYQNISYTNSFGQDIAIDHSGNIVVCGYLKNLQGLYDIIVIKYTEGGMETVSRIYNGPGRGDDIPVALKIDEANNVIVGASVKSLSNNFDMAVLKFTQGLSLSWIKTFNGLGKSDDKISSLLLDNKTNIYFCGSTFNATSSSDYFYGKLDSDGNTMWSGVFNGTGNNLDIPSSMCVDSNNVIYITGLSRSGAAIGSEDMLTLKIASGGNLLWSRYFNGIGNGIDQGNKIAVDNRGDVYVGGASDRGNVQLTYALIKYNASGLQNWTINYSLTSVPEDFIYDIALDKSNNIYVTGISLDTVNDYDMTTIKYSQPVGINKISNDIPGYYFLSQNYPNPFNASTVIRYQIINRGFVRLDVYDLLGRLATKIVNENQNEGIYDVMFNAEGLSSGIYLYKLQTGDYTVTRKMFLNK